MKRRSTVRPLFALPLILLAFSCASAPPQPPEPPAPEPEKPPVTAPEKPTPPAVPAPDDAKASAQKARAEALLFAADSSFPGDWKIADDDFAAGDKAYNVDNAASRAAYESAAKAFNELAAKAKPLFLERIAQARSRTETGRKYAFDLEAQTVLPDDWKAADALYLKGRDESAAADRGDSPSYPKALASFEASAAAFEALVRKALPLFAEARGRELEKARADALSAGAAGLDADRFAVADDEAAKAAAAYQRGEDYYGAYDTWKTARDRYLALGTGARAFALKSEIDRRNFAAYDSGNYGRAGERMDAAAAAYDAGRVQAARDAVEEAHLRYRLALAKGFELYASDRGKAAESRRVAAWEIKAHVAVKADYDAAAKKKADGDSAFKSEKYEDAAVFYSEAESQFSEAHRIAAQKRKAAEEAMQAAEARMRASEKAAQDADAILEGGAR